MKNAPIEFQQIGLDPHAFQYSDSRSWRGPCPQCGGHRRFVMFTDHEWPLYHGYCDQCGFKIKAWQKVRFHQYDPLKAAAMEAEQARHDAERTERRRVKLAEFTTAELWSELRDRMTADHVQWWEDNGIPEGLQKYLSIGYLADKKYIIRKDDSGAPVYGHSPAYAIPWFGNNFALKTLQYRLINPANPKDRYRFEYELPGGGTCYYLTDPAEAISDKVIICEGAKKAIVTWQWLAEGYTVIGTASSTTLAPALEATNDCGIRYLILDPGAERIAFKAARENKNLKALFLPMKIDDLYLAGHLDRAGFGKMLRAI